MSEFGKLKIAIVGGSLSGCIAATLLFRTGHEVTVLERSRSGLLGRGGGLTTSRTVLEELKSLDLLDADFAASPFHTLKMSKLSEENAYVGRCPLTRPIDMHCVNWGGFWQNLRKRVPDEIYFQGKTVSQAEETNGCVSLTLEDGSTEAYDLVVFADGYRSAGRKLLFPDIDLSYRGYFVWRGVLPESEVSDSDPLNDHPRYSYKNIDGSFVSFIIPDSSGSMIPGERIINWAAYIPLPAEDLPEFMMDNDGHVRSGSIPSGAMRPEQDTDLKALMTEQLPSYYGEILNKSQGNQIQLIYSCALPAYRKGRMCLVGDAGMMVQPMTGAGVFKGFSNARDLVDALGSGKDLDSALESWSIRQTRVAHRMLEMGHEMEQAFIWNTIDLAKASPEECELWWEKSIRVPEEFSYFAT
ncbi:FAD-dependent monooxygenase [Roseibium sp. HPY-6]|uniref:FAD binding domain-containing protein n=1 Tax=Roseibium sp. HPY-6 TaxID=3229852 RepID=UPI00338DE1F5